MQITDPKKLFIVFGIFLLIGLYLSIFVAFNQVFINPYFLLIFGILIAYFGGKGIYKTLQYSKKTNKKE